MKLGFDLIGLDKVNMIEDDKTLTIKDAVIAREIVHPFDGEMIYKPAEELLKTAFTAGNAWLTEIHPTVGFVTDRSEIRGTVRNPHFKNNGIYADLVFFKDMCSPAFLEEVKNGDRNQLSIGYFYRRDPTTGTWNGEPYDSVQRNFYIDHVAVVKERARCPPPFCGIGVDEIAEAINQRVKERLEEQGKKIGGDPWEETKEQIRSGHGTGEYETCRTTDFDGKLPNGVQAIYCKRPKRDEWFVQSYIFSKDAGWTLDKAKAWFKEHQEDTVESLEEAERLAAEDQEREQKRRAAEKRAARYGIAVKPGGNLSPPKGYPTSPDQYGDPVNFRYPLDTKVHCGAALRYFAMPKNRVEYSRREQLIIWERIVRACLRMDVTHRYDKNNPLDRGLPESLKRRLPGYEA